MNPFVQLWVCLAAIALVILLATAVLGVLFNPLPPCPKGYETLTVVGTTFCRHHNA